MKKFFAVFAVMVSALAGCGDDIVAPEEVKVSGVEITRETLVLGIEEKFTLSAEIIPAEAANQKVMWSSSDVAVVTVDMLSGEVTGLAEGEAIVTVTTEDGGKTDTCRVTVSDESANDEVIITGDGFDIDEEQTVLFSKAEEARVRINIKADKGIDTFIVGIASSSDKLDSRLAAMGLSGEFDLADPGDELAGKLEEIGEMGISLPYGKDVKGKTELVFDITGFIPLILQVAGECTAEFRLTVSDSEDNSLAKTLKLNFVDDSAGAIYLGMKREFNIIEAQTSIYKQYPYCSPFWPTLKVGNGYLYATSANGIYRKDLETLNDTKWELYGFEGAPVTDFLRSDGRLLAITPMPDEKAFLLSTDEGRTYIPYTSEQLLASAIYPYLSILCVSINNDPESILATIHPSGVFSSNDFGETWVQLNDVVGTYQDFFIGYHPYDGSIIYQTGEFPYYNGFVNVSFDSGRTWGLTVDIDNNCIHDIAFHRSLPNVVYYGGEAIVGKSTDYGRTWIKTTIPSVYVYKIIPHPENDDVLFALGAKRTAPSRMEIYASTDGGDSWHLFHSQDYEDPARGGAIYDALIYENKLFMYSFVDGILMLYI